jgi:hypothetical protein
MKVSRLGFNLVLISITAVAAAADLDEVGNEKTATTTTEVATTPHVHIRGASDAALRVERILLSPCSNDYETCTDDVECCNEDVACDDGVCQPFSFTSNAVPDNGGSCTGITINRERDRGKICLNDHDCKTYYPLCGWGMYCDRIHPWDEFGMCTACYEGQEGDYCDNYNHCCGEMRCLRRTCRYHYICRLEGDSCAATSDCCGEPNLVCMRNICRYRPNSPPCRSKGQYCDNVNTCCVHEDLVCSASRGTCITSVCSPSGEWCARTADCCIGLNCRSNVCIRVHY